MNFSVQLRYLSASIITALLSTSMAFAGPPDPPAGKVWVLNHEMSDEFDENSPDVNKWRVFDKANSWDRTAAFDKRIHEAVKDPNSDNYYLAMNPMWYYEDERFTNNNGRTYYFAGGGMDTRVLQTYGYFEVRIKPSDFPMGSGVFMNSRYTTDGTCNEKYHTELDIIENMGYTGPGAGTWNNFQHVNSHTKPYSDASGSCEPLPYESTNSGVSAKPLAHPLDFNTVGVWWKDANNAAFYNNDEYFGTVSPTRPFTLEMPMIIVMETYTWGDDDENNATNPKPVEYMFEDDFRTKQQRAVMYDWVRVWKLIDVDAATFNNTADNIKGLDETLSLYPTNELGTTLIYSAQTSRTVVATVFNPTGTELAKETVNVSKGVRSIYHNFKFDADLPIADGYRIVYEILDGSTVLQSYTTTVNVTSKPLEKLLWADGIPTSLLPGNTSYNIDVKYETDENSTIVIEVRKPDGSWFGGGNTDVSAGNGVATINVNTSSATTIASNYYFKVYMHRQGMNWQDPLLVSIEPTIYFNVEEAIEPDIEIVSIPTEIKNNDTEIDVSFQYETYENGTLDLVLINHDDVVVAQELRTERIGRRTITRTLDVDSVLTASDNYKIAVQFTPENSSFEALTDTVKNITIEEHDVSVRDYDADNEGLMLFPNPVDQQLHIELASATEQIKQVKIYSLYGKLLYMLNDDKKKLKTINVAVLTPGMYVTKVVTNIKVYTSDFVKR